MSWKGEKQLREAYRAWQLGQLETAIRKLDALRDVFPRAPEVLFPLARALGEAGNFSRAFEILDGAPPAADGGGVHRAILLYDQGLDEDLDAELTRLSTDNAVAPALRWLTGVRAGPWEKPSFEPVALWNAEILGRLLAQLEARYQKALDPAQDSFHHLLFAAHPPPEPPETGAEGEDATPKPADVASSPGRRGNWLCAVEDAFTCGRFDDVLGLWKNDAADGWCDLSCRPYRAYSAYAALEAGAAVDVARAELEKHTADSDLHFLHGLCLTRSGDTVAAGHAYVRSARLNDWPIHTLVVLRLAKELDLPVQPARDSR